MLSCSLGWLLCRFPLGNSFGSGSVGSWLAAGAVRARSIEKSSVSAKVDDCFQVIHYLHQNRVDGLKRLGVRKRHDGWTAKKIDGVRCDGGKSFWTL